MTVSTYPWWKDSVVYQIWPASYKDSNGDGVGDIPGIISTLDHIKDLGANVVWLSPHYASPQDDMGYDISDYEAIYEKYGTMEDMDRMIDEVHKRGMKLIFDLVINHTSSEHAWFKESRSSLNNPKRDWYIWKKPRYDSNGNRIPPTNWKSYFSGSAWEYDDTTGEYYLRLFAKSQPDLNWENEEMRNALYKTSMQFWFNKGIDGFRIDTAGKYSKDQNFEDAPIVFPDQEWQPCHKEKKLLDMSVLKKKEMNMLFLFDVVDVGSNRADKFRYEGYTLKDFKDAVAAQCEFIKDTDAWSTVFIENHDQPRSVSRFGNTSNKLLTFKSAKLLTLLQTTLTGTLFIYQGQEIAMTNVPRSWDISEYKDINTINYWNQFQKNHPNDKEAAEKLLDVIALQARDHARSPVQWDDSPNGGFTTGEPWTRVNDNYKDINVKSQVNDPSSVYSFWKKCLKLRQLHKDIFVFGDFEIVDYANDKIFSYLKTSGDKKVYIVLNFSNETVEFEPQVEGELTLISSNVDDVKDKVLSAYEGRIYLVQ
ncbi:unnamed protein product [Wickerhamomyces anomalus]